jgi:hypothetical protein
MPLIKASALSVRLNGLPVAISQLSQRVTLPAPLARWIFLESAAPFYSTDGDLPLQVGSGTIASGHSSGTNSLTKMTTSHGQSLRFGGQNWLSIPAESIGRLNVGATTGQVTVSAWVLNEDTNGGAVAGIWREDTVNPGRSYCLFYDLPYYNGDERVVGHVSRTGGATPGYPFSKDYSTSAETISRSGVWEHYAFTYDGTQAISYLNGKGTYRAPGSFTDPDGNIHTEVKNPYQFPFGMNDAPAEFTVGGVKLTAGYGNLIRGYVADLRVYDVALTPQQIQELYATT